MPAMIVFQEILIKLIHCKQQEKYTFGKKYTPDKLIILSWSRFYVNWYTQ